jgi:hypothetical protein
VARPKFNPNQHVRRFATALARLPESTADATIAPQPVAITLATRLAMIELAAAIAALISIA